MTAQYHLVAHPALRDQLRQLHAEAQRDPSGLAAQQLQAARQGLAALREGRETDFAGERLGYSDRHADLRDCAELKIPVIEERNRQGRPLGPSHRLTYREFAAAGPGQLPVRQVLAFEPRRDGRPFTVTAQRLDRRRGVPLAELDSLPNVTPATGRNKDPNRPITPVRRPLPPDLAQAVNALTGLRPAASAAQPRPPSSPTHRGQPPDDRSRQR
ncbi:hypothetical protein Kfla_4639 [Kribbella flavida DSM 17836]|uniref:Uncharacterized protein n=1 Tax=Kribbella flavida (strain DSM 17836 / JCM 10339 / NBRC 14399) TaxID=479435 RepID=D2PY51_KRIFD|nr:hypothetical protein [Kribbella flavida]ADB33657.1 hypothetical protein Kfla_4639 [Kribbella flavida DSM 17836]